MSPDTQEDFIEKFNARRLAKHETSPNTNKRKADSPPMENSQESSRSVRAFDGDEPPKMSFDDGDPSKMSFDVGNSDPDCAVDGEPGPAIETTSTPTRQTTPVTEKPAQPDDDGPRYPKRNQPVSQAKADQCAKVTADNERAQAEIEAAGVHVRDFASGYETKVTDRG
ncbi:hypothetical protein H2200_006346 [Cladophialophora chaetospira]|uniref:Uncharacterized protein n=1 Tax=Cladophialophora chaetospira TaxID=386627 RepID=A0AA38XAW7_9EURO|nr:hypothetical protein H2200_006346 [Cladophialophora chaetospira]